MIIRRGSTVFTYPSLKSKLSLTSVRSEITQSEVKARARGGAGSGYWGRGWGRGREWAVAFLLKNEGARAS